MKLELTPEVISLLRILGALLLALISLSGWLLIRLVKATYWIVNERNQIASERAEQTKKWQEFEAFKMAVEGNKTPEHPGLVSRVAQAELVARTASADIGAWRTMLGISDSKMEQKKVELIRETLGIHVRAEARSEDSEPPAREETRTGRHRALTLTQGDARDVSDLPPPARVPALRKQTPYGSVYHGRPNEDDKDKKR